MILLSVDLSGTDPRIFNIEHYQTENQRKKLIQKAKEDAENSPTTDIWIVDITKNGIESFQTEDT